jgi:hypothetical protein
MTEIIRDGEVLLIPIQECSDEKLALQIKKGPQANDI